MHIDYRETRDIPPEKILQLYRANEWSAAKKPELLYKALMHSHTLVSAWCGGELVGLGNAITDGYLVVYYAHLVVLPQYQRRGIGRRIVQIMMDKYGEFHQQVLVAEGEAVGFYEKCGFELAGRTRPMWIYQGDEH